MQNFHPSHKFFVGIDSDGCAFDTMELKHKECFTPCLVNYFELQAVSRYARQVWEFVNLYSKSRGTNRFATLVESLDRLGKRPEVRARGLAVASPDALREWVRLEPKVSNPTLAAAVERTGNATLKQTLAWSHAVNDAIEKMVRGVPPFPGLREALDTLSSMADVLVVSATPRDALRREWAEHQLDGMVGRICGQEDGSKRELLTVSQQYPAGNTLMVGDAPGDFQAARANQVLFFPIVPGSEEASWQRFNEEGLDRFLRGQFAGDYQAELLAEFDRSLPEHPPWETASNGRASATGLATSAGSHKHDTLTH